MGQALQARPISASEVVKLCYARNKRNSGRIAWVRGNKLWLLVARTRRHDSKHWLSFVFVIMKVTAACSL